MEVHLYPQCEEGRESGAELSATVPVGECPKSTGLGEAGIYENALGDALRQCKLQKDFDTRLTFVSELHRHPEAFSILDATTSQVLYSQT